MNTMTHKGHTARIEYDERDDIFVGRILGVHSIISFHGATVKELRAEFRQAVEAHVAECTPTDQNDYEPTHHHPSLEK